MTKTIVIPKIRGIKECTKACTYIDNFLLIEILHKNLNSKYQHLATLCESFSKHYTIRCDTFVYGQGLLNVGLSIRQTLALLINKPSAVKGCLL